MNLVWAEVFLLMSFAFLAELISAAHSACSLSQLCLSFILSILPSSSSVLLSSTQSFTLSPLSTPPHPGINMYALGCGAHYGEMGAGVNVYM